MLREKGFLKRIKEDKGIRGGKERKSEEKQALAKTTCALFL